MTLTEAIEYIKSREDRRWIRVRGEDYLNEDTAKRLVKAARLVVKAFEGKADDRQDQPG